jgi:hypothetical protein
MEENAIVDLAPGEMMKIIEENKAMKAALQKATAAYLYLSGAHDEGQSPGWDTLPDGAYSAPESSPGACDGGYLSGRATYLAQAADTNKWIKYWEMV